MSEQFQLDKLVDSLLKQRVNLQVGATKLKSNENRSVEYLNGYKFRRTGNHLWWFFTVIIIKDQIIIIIHFKHRKRERERALNWKLNIENYTHKTYFIWAKRTLWNSTIWNMNYIFHFPYNYSAVIFETSLSAKRKCITAADATAATSIITRMPRALAQCWKINFEQRKNEKK